MVHTNYEWYLKKDLSSYGGEWVAIIDEKVVAHGKDVSEVIKEVKTKHSNKMPLITKVRTE